MGWSKQRWPIQIAITAMSINAQIIHAIICIQGLLIVNEHDCQKNISLFYSPGRGGALQEAACRYIGRQHDG